MNELSDKNPISTRTWCHFMKTEYFESITQHYMGQMIDIWLLMKVYDAWFGINERLLTITMKNIYKFARVIKQK